MHPQEVVASEIQPEAIPLNIMFEDESLLVIDKAAGMVMHPAPGHGSGTLVNALLHHCKDLSGIGGVMRPGIVHRLDQGTTGILVVAKNDASHEALAAQFREHTILRRYRCFVAATPKAEQGVVERPIGRHPKNRKKMSVVTRRGRSACTHWRVEERFVKKGISLFEISPQTGRTHQIRVHLASIGMPILGDALYGKRSLAGFSLERPALHAARLGFVHPLSGEALEFEAPFPADLQQLHDALRATQGAT